MSVDFLDSNVLVYLFDGEHAAKQDIARRLVQDAVARESCVISFQVVQEVLNVITRKLESIARAEDAAAFMHRTLRPLWRVQPSTALCERAIALRESTGFGYYDSLIVAAALEAGCKRLLSEDLRHGQRIGGLRIENPFRA
jgi:predicted nucleic acid-binding protein